MGFFEGLDAEKYDRKYKDGDLVKRILGYFKPQRKTPCSISPCSDRPGQPTRSWSSRARLTCWKKILP